MKQPRTPYRVLINGPEKTGTHLVVRLMNKFGLKYSRDSPSVFITSVHDDTFGMSREDFHRGPRVKIWGWPEAGLPVELVRERLSRVEPGQFCHSHAAFSPELLEIFKDLDFRVLQTVRDPRDQVQSMANWYANERSPDNRRRKELGPLPHLQRLRIAIEGGMLSNGAGIPGVSEYYSIMTGWYAQPLVQMVRFEDLVGPPGGGCRQRQKQQIRSCAEILGLHLDEAELELVAGDIFGFGNSFRLGQIGTWRKVFTPELESLFKQHANDLLLELGYEWSPHW